MTEKLSLDLDQYPLGRKFLFQTTLPASRKRAAPTTKSVAKHSKRKRT